METQIRKYQKHKTDYKISVSYYVKKVADANVSPISGNKLQPVYIRVVVKRQNTSIRSRLNFNTSEAHLPEFLKLPHIAAFVANETEIIKQSIIDKKPDQNQDFKIVDWTAYYEAGFKPVFDCALMVAMNKVARSLQVDYGMSKDEYRVIDYRSIKGLQFLSKLGISVATDLLEKYAFIWRIGSYEAQFRHDTNTAVKFCFWDLHSGYYQQALAPYFGDDASKFNRLLSELHAEFISLPNPYF